jgi:hypothetical protein
MMKNWKNLFVKDEENNEEPAATTSHTGHSSSPSFPVNNNTANNNSSPNVVLNEETQEVIKVYEKGLDSINMPGYDFYEFYKSVQSTGFHNDQAYNMAYQMAKTLDSTITVQKLVNDADFYISKINDVHSQYVAQGQQKISEISEKRLSEKTNLTKLIDSNALRIAALRAELTQLENDIQNKRNTLAKVEESYLPQEQAVRAKLNANDLAKSNSASKLLLVRDNIQKFIKNI